MLEFKEYVANNDNLTRPIKIKLSDKLSRMRNWVNFGDGTKGCYDWKIDSGQPVKVHSRMEYVNETAKEGVCVDFSLIDGAKESVNLGAHIIKESMAAMYQSILDPNAPHNDVPYNLIRILAEQKYPKTAADIRKLICCCHTSLFSMNPGLQLIMLLDEAELHPEINGFEIFENYVKTKIVKNGKGEEYSMVDYFNVMVDGFKDRLSQNIKAPLDYISSALDRVRLDGKYYPFLSVLYDKNYSANDFTDIIGYYGIPYIQTSFGYHYPEGKMPEYKDGSVDVLELIVSEAILMNLTDPEKLSMCPLYYMCNGTTYEKPVCWTKPWTGTMCSYKMVSDYWGMNDKNIL